MMKRISCRLVSVFCFAAALPLLAAGETALMQLGALGGSDADDLESRFRDIASPMGQSAGTPQLLGRLWVGGAENGNMTPGRPADWTFRFQDGALGSPVLRFDLEHEKFMHLIVVSRDLARFAHIHPDWNEGSGLFTISVNRATADPDNQDADNAVAAPGSYLLFSEVKPRGKPVSHVGFAVTASGREVLGPLVPDQSLPSGAIRKYFKEDGTPGRAGDAYQVDLRVEPVAGMTHVTFNISEAMDHGGHRMYSGVTNLENWLGMPGHAILIGATGSGVEDKVFRHLHAGSHGGGHDGGHPGGHGGHNGSPGAGPEVMFMMPGEDIPPAGVYKLWGQFKHKGKVLTFPFVIGF